MGLADHCTKSQVLETLKATGAMVFILPLPIKLTTKWMIWRFAVKNPSLKPERNLVVTFLSQGGVDGGTSSLLHHRGRKRQNQELEAFLLQKR